MRIIIIIIIIIIILLLATSLPLWKVAQIILVIIRFMPWQVEHQL